MSPSLRLVTSDVAREGHLAAYHAWRAKIEAQALVVEIAAKESALALTLAASALLQTIKEGP